MLTKYIYLLVSSLEYIFEFPVNAVLNLDVLVLVEVSRLCNECTVCSR